MDRRAVARRISRVRSLPVLLLLAVLAGCGAEDEGRVVAAVSVPVSSGEHRFTATLPPGWELASRSLTPTMSNPLEILAAGTVREMRPAESSCGHMPVGALERMGPRDALVTVYERYGEPRFPARPDRFALAAKDEQSDAKECARNGDQLEAYWFGFRDAGRGFHVLVALGRDASPERREEALALLDSLRFEPGPQGVHLDPDLAVPFQDPAARLSWQMPVPPWRRYDWPLTSMQGERLVLGTFGLEQGPPDGNCTPQAATGAMPPDGAFIYLFEYVDVPAELTERTPERTGPLTLGPEQSFECFGESRTVRWKDRGRVFQAQVYLGPRASDALQRDVSSILNSIQAG
jgi:hypothetical protein